MAGTKEGNYAWRQRLKLETLVRYSGKDPPVCGRCGFTDIRALQLDHINGDGHREQVARNRPAGTAFYARLRREGWPLGYQVLCANCNWIKRVEQGEDQRGGRGHKAYGQWPQGPRTPENVAAASGSAQPWLRTC